jgi:hypothetical protein
LTIVLRFVKQFQDAQEDPPGSIVVDYCGGRMGFE